MRNKLFLLISIIPVCAYTMQDQKSIEIIAYGMMVKDISILNNHELKENKKKCEALGVSWPDNLTHVVEIRPRYYLKDKPFINCLCQNPRELNQEIIKHTNDKSKSELMRTLMTPCMPQFIPFMPHMQSMDRDYQMRWLLHECPINVTFKWSENSMIPLVSSNIATVHNQDVSRATVINTGKIWFITGCSLAAFYYVYKMIGYEINSI